MPQGELRDTGEILNIYIVPYVYKLLYLPVSYFIFRVILDKRNYCQINLEWALKKAEGSLMSCLYPYLPFIHSKYLLSTIYEPYFLFPLLSSMLQIEEG